MAPPQPSPNPPIVLPSLLKATDFKLAAKTVSDSLAAKVGGPTHAPVILFAILVLGAVSWYVRRMRSLKSEKHEKSERFHSVQTLVGKPWTKQKMRAD